MVKYWRTRCDFCGTCNFSDPIDFSWQSESESERKCHGSWLWTFSVMRMDGMGWNRIELNRID